MKHTPLRPALVAVGGSDGRDSAGITDGARWVPLREVTPDFPVSLDAIIRGWVRYEQLILQTLDDPATLEQLNTQGRPLEPATVRAPVSGGQTYCAIGNFADQLVEASQDAAAPDVRGRRPAESATSTDLDQTRNRRRAAGPPYVAVTGAARIAAPGQPLTLPDAVDTLDWEIEIAAIIGRPGSQLSPDQAMDAVAGYSIANDLTLRGSVFRGDLPALGSDWLASKGRAGWLPLGPVFVPARHVPAPNRLGLELKLNGRVMQSGRTQDMVFDIAELISHISHHTDLQPGDVVCTGSPAGFGSHYGRYLRGGDVVEASVEGLGAQQLVVITSPGTVDPGHH